MKTVLTMLLLGATSVLVAQEPYEQVTWRYFDRTADTTSDMSIRATIYISSAQVTAEGTRKQWMKRAYTSGELLIAYIEYDCKGHARLLYGRVWDAAGTLTTKIDEPAPWSTVGLDPGTVGEAVMQAACK